jgi:hypothetical protein
MVYQQAPPSGRSTIKPRLMTVKATTTYPNVGIKRETGDRARSVTTTANTSATTPARTPARATYGSANGESV